MTNHERIIQDIKNIHIGSVVEIDNRRYICVDKNGKIYLESDDLMQQMYQGYYTTWSVYNLIAMILFYGRNGYYKDIKLIR